MAEDESDQSAPDDSSKKLPEGMRVVRGSPKRQGGSRETLYLKKKREIVTEEPAREGESAGVKEEVAPLKSGRSEPDGKPVEEPWGGPRSTQGGASWMVLRILALLVPVLAIVTAIVLMKDEKPSAPANSGGGLDLGISEDDQEFKPVGPTAWLEENLNEAYATTIELLKRLNEASPDQLPERVFRKEDDAKVEISKSGLGWNSPFITWDLRKFRWNIGSTRDIGYLIVEGLREDQSKYRSYFVKTDDGLRMDWEASTVWSEIPLSDLPTRKVERAVLVRGILTKEAHYDSLRGPAALKSWYLLTTPVSDAQIWVFAAKGSPRDEELKKLFGFERVLLERRSEVRATLRLSKPETGVKENQFKIEELVTEEWVMP